MAGIKQTPRQRLVNMMYLVLIALLALNVSDEVLNAFRTVKESLENTTNSFAITADNTMSAFESAMDNDPDKTKPFYDKALLAQQYTNELYNHIEELKKEIEGVVGLDEETGYLEAPGDLDAVNQVLLREGTAKGAELKQKIIETREKLLALIPEADRSSVSIPLRAEDPETGAKKWEHIMFESVPATAGLTILAKLQTDAKNAEVEISRYLLTAINASDFKFDVLEPAVVAPTSYVLTGQPYEAQIFLTASNSTQQPDVMVNGQKLPVQGNKAIFSATHTTPGEYEYKGTIRVPSPDGSVKEYPFSQSYQVSAPTAVVSADKMNVLYIGVDNPISVSVPGVPRESIRASIGNGTLNGSNGTYTARVTSAGTTEISVSAEVGGEVRSLGSQTFRVRTVPPPIPKFGGINSGALSASVAKVQPGVFAVLENFDFDMEFTVTRFTMIISRRRADPFVQTASSNALTPQMKQALSTVAAGDVIAIDDIYVRGGDGTNRKLEQGIAVRIQ